MEPTARTARKSAVPVVCFQNATEWSFMSLATDSTRGFHKSSMSRSLSTKWTCDMCGSTGGDHSSCAAATRHWRRARVVLREEPIQVFPCYHGGVCLAEPVSQEVHVLLMGSHISASGHFVCMISGTLEAACVGEVGHISDEAPGLRDRGP